MNRKEEYKELKFTDNLKQCISDGNTKPKYVEIFLVNGIGLKGNITYASENIVTIGTKELGYTNIQPMHIGTYTIEPPRKKRKTNYNR